MATSSPPWWRVGVVRLAEVLASLVRPIGRVLDRLAFVVFEQRAPDSKSVTWLPGHGTHGGDGGQVPPYVPYNPDWDPKVRKR